LREAIAFPKILAQVSLYSLRRWIVLTNNLLLTYKEQRVYNNPTEVIQLREILSIKTADEESNAKNAFVTQ
jgi:hypothetical protein